MLLIHLSILSETATIVGLFWKIVEKYIMPHFTPRISNMNVFMLDYDDGYMTGGHR